MRAHQLSRKYGAARIRHDLRSKGVSEELAERAVAGSDELQRAKGILARKYPQPAMTREERLQRARFLHSRGFRYETIYQAVRIEGDE